MIGLDKDDIKRIAKNTHGLAAAGGTHGYKNAAEATICKNAPDGIYWLDESNPYTAKYGIEKDEWGVET